MIQLRPSADRGHANHGWLDTHHTFSFADYHDPRHMGFRALRVINEDLVQPGTGFGTHSHRDMEIVTYVLDGALEHKDSLGNGSVIRPGEVQRMTAGTGVSHSEYNPSRTETVHFLQIWILPQEEGLPPGYEQRAFPASDRRGRLRLVASGYPREGSLTIHQDADLFASLLEQGERVEHRFRPGRHGWLQMARGSARLNGITLTVGDGAAISGEDTVMIESDDAAELLLFDLA